ncbi:serine hydrolase [Psychrobium sp. nBUS_13]|uniref:serine hydrolase n=1 Tax=Psychrobium sp. nBUS_13 TaxID=3395319 RepID=UPI003EB828CE
MKNLIKPIVLFALTSIVSVSSATTIRAIVDDAHKNDAFNGAVLVIDGNKEQFKSVYGFESGSRTAPLTLEHRFSIGSISKEFPAAVIQQLVTKKEFNQVLKERVFIPNMMKNAVNSLSRLQFALELLDGDWPSLCNKYVGGLSILSAQF